MKKTIIASSLAALILSGCSEPSINNKSSEVEKVAAKADSPQAELGTFGVDLSARDESVKPGDDFFMYASGTWYENYKMPADKTRFGAFSALAERSENRLKLSLKKSLMLKT